MISFREYYETKRAERERLESLLAEMPTEGMTELEVYQELIYSLGYMPRPE